MEAAAQTGVSAFLPIVVGSTQGTRSMSGLDLYLTKAGRFVHITGIDKSSEGGVQEEKSRVLASVKECVGNIFTNLPAKCASLVAHKLDGDILIPTQGGLSSERHHVVVCDLTAAPIGSIQSVLEEQFMKIDIAPYLRSYTPNSRTDTCIDSFFTQYAATLPDTKANRAVLGKVLTAYRGQIAAPSGRVRVCHPADSLVMSRHGFAANFTTAVGVAALACLVFGSLYGCEK